MSAEGQKAVLDAIQKAREELAKAHDLCLKQGYQLEAVWLCNADEDAEYAFELALGLI